MSIAFIASTLLCFVGGICLFACCDPLPASRQTYGSRPVSPFFAYGHGA